MCQGRIDTDGRGKPFLSTHAVWLVDGSMAGWILARTEECYMSGYRDILHGCLSALSRRKGGGRRGGVAFAKVVFQRKP